MFDCKFKLLMPNSMYHQLERSGVKRTANMLRILKWPRLMKMLIFSRSFDVRVQVGLKSSCRLAENINPNRVYKCDITVLSYDQEGEKFTGVRFTRTEI